MYFIKIKNSWHLFGTTSIHRSSLYLTYKFEKGLFEMTLTENYFVQMFSNLEKKSKQNNAEDVAECGK